MAENSPNGLKKLGKGEIARYEQCPLFPQCFQKTCTSDTVKQGFVWEMVNILSFSFSHSFFKTLVMYTRQNRGFFWKRLNVVRFGFDDRN